MVIIYFLLFSYNLYIPIGFSNDITFYKNGGYLKKITHKDVIKNGMRKIELFNPITRELEPFKATDFQMLLGSIDPDWRKRKEIVFLCKDDYQPYVSIAKLSKNKSYLAIGKYTGGQFSTISGDKGQVINLEPYYLIWKNASTKSAVDRAYWPKQIIGVNIIDYYLPIAPPAFANNKIRKGYRAFKAFCLGCHSINKYGSPFSIDLNRPSVVHIKGRKWVEDYIENPIKLNPSSRMNKFISGITNRKEIIENIVDYLEYHYKIEK